MEPGCATHAEWQAHRLPPSVGASAELGLNHLDRVSPGRSVQRSPRWNESTQRPWSTSELTSSARSRSTSRTRAAADRSNDGWVRGRSKGSGCVASTISRKKRCGARSTAASSRTACVARGTSRRMPSSDAGSARANGSQVVRAPRLAPFPRFAARRHQCQSCACSYDVPRVAGNTATVELPLRVKSRARRRCLGQPRAAWTSLPLTAWRNGDGRGLIRLCASPPKSRLAARPVATVVGLSSPSALVVIGPGRPITAQSWRRWSRPSLTSDSSPRRRAPRCPHHLHLTRQHSHRCPRRLHLIRQHFPANRLCRLRQQRVRRACPRQSRPHLLRRSPQRLCQQSQGPSTSLQLASQGSVAGSTASCTTRCLAPRP